jgi:hypothetical protein
MKKNLIILSAIFLLCLSFTCFMSNAMAAEPVTTSFSFASDTYHNGPTFTGSEAFFTSNAEVNLLVDLNEDNYGGLAAFLSLLRLKAELRDYRAYYVGSQWLHVWKVYSEMTFTHVNPPLNSPILGIGFKEGVLTSWSPNSNTVGETMTLQNSESADPSIYMEAYPILNGVGVTPEHLAWSKDLAFTFTNVRFEKPGALVPIDEKGNFLYKWKAEGSFSASAYLK